MTALVAQHWSIANLLGKPRKAGYPKDAIMAFVGLGASGRDDISERHDEALAEAFVA